MPINHKWFSCDKMKTLFIIQTILFEKLHIGTLNCLLYSETMLNNLSVLIAICKIDLFTNNGINLVKPTSL